MTEKYWSRKKTVKKKWFVPLCMHHTSTNEFDYFVNTQLVTVDVSCDLLFFYFTSGTYKFVCHLLLQHLSIWHFLSPSNVTSRFSLSSSSLRQEIEKKLESIMNPWSWWKEHHFGHGIIKYSIAIWLMFCIIKFNLTSFFLLIIILIVFYHHLRS